MDSGNGGTSAWFFWDLGRRNAATWQAWHTTEKDTMHCTHCHSHNPPPCLNASFSLCLLPCLSFGSGSLDHVPNSGRQRGRRRAAAAAGGHLRAAYRAARRLPAAGAGAPELPSASACRLAPARARQHRLLCSRRTRAYRQLLSSPRTFGPRALPCRRATRNTRHTRYFQLPVAGAAGSLARLCRFCARITVSLAWVQAWKRGSTVAATRRAATC